MATGYLMRQGIYTGIGASITSIYTTLRLLYNYNNTDLSLYLKRLDIEYKLKMVSSVLHKHYGSDTLDMKDKPCDKTIIFTVVKNEDLNAHDPLELNLNYLSASVKEIFDNLITIQRITASHKQKWFHAFRAVNIKTQLENLEINVKNLETRFDNYMKISNMINN